MKKFGDFIKEDLIPQKSEMNNDYYGLRGALDTKVYDALVKVIIEDEDSGLSDNPDAFSEVMMNDQADKLIAELSERLIAELDNAISYVSENQEGEYKQILSLLQNRQQ